MSREPPGPRAADLLIRQLAAAGTQSAIDTPMASNDWSDLEGLAVRHGLAPLLFRRLKQSGMRTSVPDDVWERLRRAYFMSAEWNLRLYRELRMVLQCLRSRDIKVIVLKGAYLAETVYGDIALRPMCDVDLMVTRAELPKAQSVLVDSRRVQLQPTGSESRWGRSTRPRLSTGVGIDLHWTIAFDMGPFAIDPAGLWSRARHTSTAGVDVLVLSPEDLLLHLCLHMSYSHGLEAGLRPLCDIAETTRRFRSEMDWPQVVQSAHVWGATRYVGLSLHLARSLLGAAIPDYVQENLVPGGVPQHVLETAGESVLAQEIRGGWGVRPIFGLWGAESLGEKAGVFWRRVFLSRDELAVLYPASRVSRHRYLYYALRVRDVIRTYACHTQSQSRIARQSSALGPPVHTPADQHGRDNPLFDWLTARKP